jgi:cytochrome c peroxidase
MRRLLRAGVLFVVAAGAAVGAVSQREYVRNLPPGFPQPPVPADNPMSHEKAELGRYLFYDARLSVNGRQSCATCHRQALAFTDGRARAVGATGEIHPRGSMSLVNIAYAAALTWGNPTVTRLEDQALVPMYGEHPVELGLNRADGWIAPLTRDATYQRLFAAAYPDESDPFTRDNIVRAIASFERTIISGRSPYDRYHFGRDDSAVSASVKRGEVLFFSRPQSCFTCHGGFNFSGAVTSQGRRRQEVEFHNTGLYNVGGLLSYPLENLGVYQATRNPRDVGKFKAPTLRNIAVTAPYMHDGSVGTLEEAIAHYEAGGRTIADGPLRGIGRDNPNKSPAVRGFTLTAGQRADLIAFLRSLTDDQFLRDARLANPWDGGAPG